MDFGSEMKPYNQFAICNVTFSPQDFSSFDVDLLFLFIATSVSVGLDHVYIYDWFIPHNVLHLLSRSCSDV